MKTPKRANVVSCAAERFAGVWKFKWKLQRRGDWTQGLQPTKAMWEHVFDGLQRRYRRREGVSDEDLTQVERILKAWIEPRDLENPTNQPRAQASAFASRSLALAAG